MPGLQLCALRQLRGGIHGDIVVGIGPGSAEEPARAGCGAAPARHFLQGADISAVRHIPGPGQGGRIGGVAFHSNSSRRANGNQAAGIAVRKAPGLIAAPGVDLQVFQQGRVVAAAAAFGGNGAGVVARSLGVAKGDGHTHAHRNIVQYAVAAGIVLGHKSQVGGSFCDRLGLFLTVFVGVCDFFFYGLVGLPAHVDRSVRIGNGLGLIGSPVLQRDTGGTGFGVGHILVRVAYNGLSQHIVRRKGIAVVHCHPGNQVVVIAAGGAVGVVDGYAQCAKGDGLHFRMGPGGVGRLQGHSVCRKGISVFIDADRSVAIVPGLGHVHRHGHDAAAYAHQVGHQLAAAFGLQGDLFALLGDFGSLVAVAICRLFSLGGGSRQLAAARYRNVCVRFAGIVGHADGHGKKARRSADDLAGAPGVVFGFQGDIAVGGLDSAVIHRNAGAGYAVVGIALDGDAGVAYADGCHARAGLDHAGKDGVVLIGRHITLVGVDGHALAFDRGIHDRDIAHFVQVEHHVRHVDGRRPCRAAAAVQVGVGAFLVVNGQSVAGFQFGIVLYIGMYACPVDAFLVVDPGLGLVRHFVLFVIGHAVQDVGQGVAGAAFFGTVEVFGQVASVIVVYRVRYAVDGVLMAEVYGVAVLVRGVRIHRVRQVVDTVVHRHGEHVHGNAGGAHTHTGHKRFQFPVGFGLDGQLLVRFQFAVFDQGRSGTVEGIHFHADADAGADQRACAFAGGIVDLYGVGGTDIDIVRRQFASLNISGGPVVHLVDADAAGNAGAVQAGRHTHGDQGGLQLAGVVRFYGKIGRTAAGFLNIAVLHPDGGGGLFIHYAHAYIQGAGPGGGGRHAHGDVHVVDAVLVGSFYFRIFGVVHGGVGDSGRRGALHGVDVHVVAGLSGGGGAGRYGRHYVQGRHGLHRVGGHVEVLGVDRILGLIVVTDGVHLFVVVPGGLRGSHGSPRGPVDFVHIDVDARRAPEAAGADTHGNRAGKFRRIGIVCRVHGDVAALVACIDLGIQHFGRGGAAHIVQVDNAGHFHADAAGTDCHADIAHVGGNGMGAGGVHYHAGLFLFLAAFLQVARGPGVIGHRPVDQVAVVHFALCFYFVVFAALGYDLAVLDQGRGIAGEFVVGTGDADGDSRVGCARYTYVHNAGVVADGLIALGHHAHVA